jgi:hypothetical protein
MKYFVIGKIYTTDDVKNIISTNAIANSSNQERFYWTIISRDGIIGRVFIIFSQSNNEKEIIYCIVPEQQGKGIATATSKALWCQFHCYITS